MGWQAFLKGPDSKYFRFVCPYVSVAVTQLYHGNGNTFIDNSEMDGHVFVLIKLHFQKHVATLQAIVCQALAYTVNQTISQSLIRCLQIPWCKYSHHDQLQATSGMPLKLELYLLSYCVCILYLHFYHTDTIDIHRTDYITSEYR